VQKICVGCKQEVAHERFDKDHRHKDGLTSRCSACISAQRKVRYQENKEVVKALTKARYWANPKKARDWALSYKYNLTPEQFHRLYISQECKCAICAKHFPEEEKMAVDHCHDNGNVRGLLCHACNRGMGLLKDNPDILRKAAEYLDQFPPVITDNGQKQDFAASSNPL
jgi:hypothetical protein